jgi:hypothetical protein
VPFSAQSTILCQFLLDDHLAHVCVAYAEARPRRASFSGLQAVAALKKKGHAPRSRPSKSGHASRGVSEVMIASYCHCYDGLGGCVLGGYAACNGCNMVSYHLCCALTLASPFSPALQLLSSLVSLSSSYHRCHRAGVVEVELTLDETDTLIKPVSTCHHCHGLDHGSMRRCTILTS